LRGSERAVTAEARVALEGELDYRTEALTRSLLTEAMERGDTATVVVDCCAVTFIDSAGIRELVRAKRQLDARGRRFRIENLHGTPRRALEIASLRGTLNVSP
jgi:anti-anti-sigma factor